MRRILLAISWFLASIPAPAATIPESAPKTPEQIAPQNPRVHFKAMPPVCRAVAGAVSSGTISKLETGFPEEGLLIDINGDGEKERVTLQLRMAHVGHTSIHVATQTGMPIELDPAGEEDEQLIAFGGKYYIYSYSHDQEPDDIPRYLATIDKDNKEKIVCEFAESKPMVTIAESRNDSLCTLGREAKLDYVPFDKPYGTLTQGKSRLTVESRGAGSVDINNDGALERVVQVADYSSNAWPVCVRQGLGVLNHVGNGLDESFTELLVDQNCPDSAGAHRPFLFGGKTYIAIFDPDGYPYSIVQMKGKALDRICRFHRQRVFHVLKH